MWRIVLNQSARWKFRRGRFGVCPFRCDLPASALLRSGFWLQEFATSNLPQHRQKGRLFSLYYISIIQTAITRAMSVQTSSSSGGSSGDPLVQTNEFVDEADSSVAEDDGGPATSSSVASSSSASGALFFVVRVSVGATILYLIYFFFFFNLWMYGLNLDGPETGSIDKDADMGGTLDGSASEVDFEDADEEDAGEQEKKKKKSGKDKKNKKKDKKKKKKADKKKKTKKKKKKDADDEEVEMVRVMRCLPCKKKKQKPTVSLFKIYWYDKRQVPLLLLGVLGKAPSLKLICTCYIPSAPKGVFFPPIFPNFDI